MPRMDENGMERLRSKLQEKLRAVLRWDMGRICRQL